MRSKLGFTLIELLVASAIGAIVVAVTGPAVFQVLTGIKGNNNRFTSLHQVQQAGAWISRDGLRAASITVPEGNGLPLTLVWGDFWPQGQDNVSTVHTVVYTLEGDRLQRQEHLETTVYDSRGNQQGATTVTDTTTVVAQYVVSAVVSWNDGKLQVTLAARRSSSGSKYAEETETYETTPRVGW